MRRLVNAELMKFRTRWFPYVLALIAVAGVAFQVWVGGYVSWQSAEGFQDTAVAARTFALPWSLVALLDAGQSWGAILVGVFTASVVATDFGWGTVRQSLIRGHSRGSFLFAKAFAIALASAIALLIVLAVGIVFCIFASSLAGEAITLHVRGGPSTAGIVMMVVRAAYAILPYGLMALMITVVTRSTAAGATMILLYVFIEAAVISILGSVGGTWADARGWLLGHNVASLMAVNRIGSADYHSLAIGERASPGELPDPIVATVVIALYCVAFVAITYRVFASRDVRAPDGSQRARPGSPVLGEARSPIASE